MTTGADYLCDVLLTNDVDVCFANPGTSEMHFVAALDRKPEMRCVLGLFEGVVTGAADGYARMTDKPAATLLHLGPGLANGLANLHNARRGQAPMINIVGEHASHHVKWDAPLTSDIESLARPMSNWVGRVAGPWDVRARAEEAYANAMLRGGVSTLILPADAAWGSVNATPLAPVAVGPRPGAAPDTFEAAARALAGGKKCAIILSGMALREKALDYAGRIAAKTDTVLYFQTSGRNQRGAGRVQPRPVPYSVGAGAPEMAEIDVAICIGATEPVSFFAYPGMPSRALRGDCEIIQLATHAQDHLQILEALCDAVNANGSVPAVNALAQADIPVATGKLDPDSIAFTVARLLPENAILCEEGITSISRHWRELTGKINPHDHLALTGGAIGAGIPLAVGAAIAAPGRKVINLQADGSGLYTSQGLWTQARERLDIVTVIFANRSYAILKGEMRNVGVNTFGENARRMLQLDDPAIDWVSLARGYGVESARAETVEQFADLFAAALKRQGPFLIEAVID